MLQTQSVWQETADTSLLAQMAVDAALSSNWKDAASINEKIISLDKSDIEALNRLAHAYICLGNKEKAKSTYNKVLLLDPYNIIAAKNVDKISKMNGSTITSGHSSANLNDVFLFEPGKTKIINLLNLAPPAVLANLNCGDKLLLVQKKHSVTINSEDGTYLGALPDDLAHRLIGFITGGNKYEAYVKCATPKILTVFIRESERAPRYTNQPSFADGGKSIYSDEKDIVS